MAVNNHTMVSGISRIGQQTSHVVSLAKYRINSTQQAINRLGNHPTFIFMYYMQGESPLEKK